MSLREGFQVTLAACILICNAARGEVLVEKPGPCSRKTGFVISEIMYKPAESIALETEFLEIYNSNPFEEELSGYRISGEIDFTFPEGTMLAGLSHLILAKDKVEFQQYYNLTNATVFAYGEPDGGNSLGRSGKLRMINSSGGVVLSIEYDDDRPWPVAADGSGHSMVLARPSLGEGNPQAWSASDSVGGSPCATDVYGDAELRHVMINEILAHTDEPQLDAIELYNHSNLPVDLSGCILSDDKDLAKYRIPDETIIAERGYLVFDQMELGFSLSAAGETIYFWNAATNRMLDAVQFGGQENGVGYGRFPNGATEFYRLDSQTLGYSNAVPLISDVVINEIMYDPVSGDKDDEFIELFNRGASAVDLSGWQLSGGIEFAFPEDTWLEGGGYLVVAHDAARLQTNYAQLNATNLFGNYSGALANGGEWICLEWPDTVIDYTLPGVPETNDFFIAVDEVAYKTGGQWPVWAKGGGSSMERVDPRANPRYPSSWADSDESGKAVWTNLEVSGRLERGATDSNRIEGGLQAAGECLLDDVEVIYLGSNCVNNSTFDFGMEDWVARGAFARSSLDLNECGESPCLRIRGSDRYDVGANRMLGMLSTTMLSGSNATIRARVKWQKGYPYFFLRIHGNYLEAVARLDVPLNLGTPGLVNSRFSTNTAPVISGVTHRPVLPESGEDVVVTARVEDPDGLSSVELHYRIDPSNTHSVILMNDLGQSGDDVAGDGVYSGTIPGQSTNILVAFTVAASDSAPVSLRRVYPGNAVDNNPRPRECLVRFGDATRGSSFGTYRMWFTAAALDDWRTRLAMSNEPVEGTFVYNDERVIYNFSARYAGSPFHQHWLSPTNDCNYSMTMPLDDELLGTDNFNKLHGPGNYPFMDETLQREQTGFWVARQLRLPWLYRRYVNVYVNGAARKVGSLMEDTQVPGAEFIREYWPDDSNGNLHKANFWWEFDDSSSQAMPKSWRPGAQFRPYYNFAGELHAPSYRWTWAPRAYGHGGANDFSALLRLIEAANSGESMLENMLQEADVENWMRTWAVRHAMGDHDFFGCRNGQNSYSYKPENGRWAMLIWDMNHVVGHEGSFAPGRALFPEVSHFGGDATLTKIYNNVVFRRMYLRALKEICDGPFLASNVDRLLDARYQAFAADGLAAESPDTWFSHSETLSNRSDGQGPGLFEGTLKSWFVEARTNILNRIAEEDAEAFMLESPGHIGSTNYSIDIEGWAPVDMASISVNGIDHAIIWNSLTHWAITTVVSEKNSTLNLQGMDIYGAPIFGYSTSVTVKVCNETAWPEDAVLINEWMADNDNELADDMDGDFEDWFELYNSSTQQVDLGGLFLTDDLADPFQFQIPTNGQYVIEGYGYLLVWADKEPEQNADDSIALHVNFALSKNGESIALVAADGRIIDSVTFAAQSTDESEGRIPDGNERIEVMNPATPASENHAGNTAPVLADISDFYLYVGESVSFTAQVADAESDYQTLTFSLGLEAPLGSMISSNGIFWWDVPAGVTQSQFSATVQVEDSGLPPLGDEHLFSIYVHAVPELVSSSLAAGESIVLSAETLQGHSYQLKYKNRLDDPDWLALGDLMTNHVDSMEWKDSLTNSCFYQLYIYKE